MPRARPRQEPLQPELPLSKPLAKTVPRSAAQLAKITVARRWTPDAGKLRASLTMWLTRETAELLTERAIAEGKKLEALVAEILERAVKR